MAFVALHENALYGVVQVWIDPDDVTAEFSIIIDDHCRGEGLGVRLMEEIMAYLTKRGVIEINSTVLPHNTSMIKLAEKLHFKMRRNAEEGVIEIARNLNSSKFNWQKKRLLRL